MLEVFEIMETPPQGRVMEVVLTFDERQKSRHKTTTACGAELGWFIERGRVLQDGDFLKCKTGEVVRVTAAAEAVSEVRSNNPLQLTRAAYHLGNRHVPLQIGPGFLRYIRDHVLDDMVRGLDLEVHLQEHAFQPENGAYHGQQSLLLLHKHHHH
jgi:urease accessory protein